MSSFGLNEEELEALIKKLGREPNTLELAIVGALWSEHCSYKSSRMYLKKLPTKSPAVVQGPGENAGVVKLDDDVWLAFKIESHNHPSFIEPFNGSATGVGGIIRDILSMGARPIAILNSLRFPLPFDKRITKGVIKGISHYGNCIGVANAGGETFFESCYLTNPLVNVFCLGILPANRMITARGERGDLIILFGSATGKDGLHGAVMASGEIDPSEKNLKTIQVGDPYFGRKLIEASLELIELGLIKGLQDLGAAGLVGACSELASKSQCGVRIELDSVPLREKEMNELEIALSESQERMIATVSKENSDKALEVIKSHLLEGAVIGQLTESEELELYFKGQKVANLPIKILTKEAPICERPFIFQKPPSIQENPPPVDILDSLKKLLSSPNVANKRGIYTQFDYHIGTNTIFGPGADSALLRIKWPKNPRLKSSKLVAISSEGNSRLVYIDPFWGSVLVVSEALRNLACVGAKPLAITDCLNFGNPERPEIMGQLVNSIDGIAHACEFFSVPVVSGNVSLYNETIEGNLLRNIYPTPIVVAVGWREGVPSHDHRFKEPSDLIYLIGDIRKRHCIGGSEFLSSIHGKVLGPLPEIDLNKEKTLHELLLELSKRELINSCHDVSVGGLLVSILESVFNTSLGLELEFYIEDRLDLFLFSECPTMVIVSVSPSKSLELQNIVESSGLDWMLIGRVSDHRALEINNNCEKIVSCDIEELEKLWEEGLLGIF
ncbi:MAG: phosphoribosylformylglycinamidine synthase subunit PurL [Aquificaceae bacterium]|nr:phosphoribosylformylglycinamidine synthase subunit PurL [Aquificaceae bacterium]MDW8236830.1 phosphoribosylformylglycinamidine synthase subunit PurL [Aquificaceae bacterium]